MRTPVEVASAWISKAKEESDSFDKFVYLWFAFNALYSQYYFNNERSAIYEFINDKYRYVDRGALTRLLEKPAVNYFKDRVIRDCRGTGYTTEEYAIALKNKNNNPKYRLSKLAMILYQVRCNLFHGEKHFFRDSDQEVMGNAAEALMGFMDLFNQRVL